MVETVRWSRHLPPHLRSCPCLAAWLELRRRHTTTHGVSRRAASLMLLLNTYIFFQHHTRTDTSPSQKKKKKRKHSRNQKVRRKPLSHRLLQNTSAAQQPGHARRHGNRVYSTFHSTYSVGVEVTTFTLFHAVASYSVKCGDVATGPLRGDVELDTARTAPPRGREVPSGAVCFYV